MANKSHSSVQDTVISRALQIRGNIKSLTNLHFDGTVVGNIACENDVILGPNSFVEGKVSCQNLEADGTVVGDLEVGSRLALHANANIQGNIKAQSLAVDEGAYFSGTITMPSPPAEEENLNPPDSEPA